MDVLQMLDDIIYGGFKRGHAVNELAASGRTAVAELIDAAHDLQTELFSGPGLSEKTSVRFWAALAACRPSQPKSAE